jgi:hypothetical protein
MMGRYSFDRRGFLAARLGLAAPAVFPRTGHASPAERVRVGLIGTGNQGMGLLERFSTPTWATEALRRSRTV